jgi:hypothetical protein
MVKNPRPTPQQRLAAQRWNRVQRNFIVATVELGSASRELNDLGAREIATKVEKLSASIEALHEQLGDGPAESPDSGEFCGELRQGSLSGLTLEADDVVEILLADGGWVRGRFGYFREGTSTAFDWALSIRFPCAGSSFVEAVTSLPLRAWARISDRGDSSHPGGPRVRRCIESRDGRHHLDNLELVDRERIEVFMEDGEWLAGNYAMRAGQTDQGPMIAIQFGRGALPEHRPLFEHRIAIPEGAYVRRSS